MSDATMGFLSFFISKKYGAVTCGNPYSHANSLITTNPVGWYKNPDGYIDTGWREATWGVNDEVIIDIAINENENSYKAFLFSMFETREELAKYLSPSRDQSGTIYTFNHIGFHSFDDTPAIRITDGGKLWYYYGKVHRANDLPAIIYPDGSMEYWVDGHYTKTVRGV